MRVSQEYYLGFDAGTQSVKVAVYNQKMECVMVNPRYIEPLFTQKIGQLFVGGALVLELIGFIIIQKIASLDV